jgi:hypothetical protein
LRAADDAILARNVAENADAFLGLGTTTIEAKSGYGLSRSTTNFGRCARSATSPLGTR